MLSSSSDHVQMDRLDRFITEKRAHFKQEDGVSKPELVNFLHSLWHQFNRILQDGLRNHFLTSKSKYLLLGFGTLPIFYPVVGVSSTPTPGLLVDTSKYGEQRYGTFSVDMPC